MNTTVAVAILAIWAGAATFAMVLALRSRARTQRKYTLAVGQLAQKEAHLARAQEELRRATTRTVPLKDDGQLSMARALRKITGPVKPTSARTPTTSRSSSPDVMNGSLVAPTVWSGNYGSPDPSPSTSCDTSSTSSSSSSDGGSCGGGE